MHLFWAWGWDEWLFVSLVVVVLVSVSIHNFYLKAKPTIVRELKKSTAKPFYAVKDGDYVRLHGTVEAYGDLIASELTKTPCVFYNARALIIDNKEEYIIGEEFKYTDFTITDGESKVLIRPIFRDTITFHLGIDTDSQKHDSKFDPDRIQAFYERSEDYPYDRLNPRTSSNKYTESLIVPGDKIAIKGVASWKKDEETGKRFLEVNSSYKQKMLITDDPEVIRTLPK